MVYVRWLLTVLMLYVNVPGFRSVCWNSSICNNLSNERRIRDCIQLCMPRVLSELSDVTAEPVRPTADTDNDDKLLIGLIVAALASSNNKLPESSLTAHSAERRSYSMQHFRWGKPSGRKRRPIKVFTSMEAEGSSAEGTLGSQARRQLSSNEDEARMGPTQDGQPGTQRTRSGSKASERKNGNYRMSHFRWGNPPATKRSGSLMKQLVGKPKRELARIFRNILLKDVQRLTE